MMAGGAEFKEYRGHWATDGHGKWRWVGIKVNYGAIRSVLLKYRESKSKCEQVQ